MFNYLIRIEYDGSNFCGMAISKEWYICSRKIEKAIRKIIRKKVRIIGAGRTDKGVHALNQCASFQLDKKIIDLKKFIDSINFFLNKDFISILKLKKKVSIFMQDFQQKSEFMNILSLIDLDLYL